jgi:hypothetical protein
MIHVRLSFLSWLLSLLLNFEIPPCKMQRRICLFFLCFSTGTFLTLETIKRPFFRDFIGPLKSLSLMLSLWLVQLIDKVVFVFSNPPLLFLCYQLFCNLCIPSLCLFNKLWVSDPMSQIWVWGFSFLWFWIEGSRFYFIFQTNPKLLYLICRILLYIFLLDCWCKILLFCLLWIFQKV